MTMDTKQRKRSKCANGRVEEPDAQPPATDGSNGAVNNGHCHNNSTPLPQTDSSARGERSWFPWLVATKTAREVPGLFREPYVEAGFRAVDQSWTYYLCSILQLHNETLNVWTHLLAVVLTTCKLASFSQHVDFLRDPYSWPLLAGGLCGVGLYAVSSCAHCFQSKSEIVHYASFMLDYAAVGIYGLGSVMLHYWYCSEDVFYQSVKDYFIPVGGAFAFLIFYCCTVAKMRYRRPYPRMRKVWQIAPVGGVYIVLISPIVHRLVLCYLDNGDCNASIPYHLQQVFWFALSGFFFSTQFPQNLRPGTFDYFFHSHQIFHVCIMMCTLAQMDGVFIDFQTRADVFRHRPAPSLVSAFGPVLMVCVCDHLVITTFLSQIKAGKTRQSK